MTAKTIEVGYPTPRFDARSKVTGEEKYAADLYPENLLWIGVKRANAAHGTIRGIDTSAARKVPGVFAVLTHRDITGTNRQGIVHKDQPVLADVKVRHCGDPVALVLAESRESLREALRLVSVDMDALPAVFDPEEALLPEAPLVHDSGNLLLKAVVSTGNAPDAFKDCDIVVEDSFETAGQEHAFLETENGVARREPDGRIVMTVSSQAPFRDRFEIAHALGIQPDAIRIDSPYLGGGFGGKDGATVQCFLALAAMHSGGRPVKMWWDREESFVAGYKRHPVRMRYRLGAMRDGTLRALHCSLYYNTGAYAHLG
ncbi:MAG: molybdopterin cofactor-binding domain-containing protein, partial [Syntrophobacteraceae bacterium]